MANFHAILDPLVSHGKLDGNDLCALATVDKLCKSTVDWNVIKQEYANSTKLNQRQDVQYICWQQHRRSDERMGFTKALVKYRLKAADVAHIPHSRVSLGDCIEIKPVVGVALMKHGGPSGLREAMQPRYMFSKARRRREDNIARLNLTAIEKQVLYPLGLQEYLKNGMIGRRGLKDSITLVEWFRGFVTRCANSGLAQALQDRMILLYSPYKNFIAIKEEAQECSLKKPLA